MSGDPIARASGDGRFRLLCVGVGGQGVVTIARLLGEAAHDVGLEVVVGQLHGLSQRGGSVRSTVLIGPGRSSFIGRGQADVVLGLEPLELLRARAEMGPATRVVVNRGEVVPYTITQSGEEYPDVAKILAEVRSIASSVIDLDGSAIAERAGDPRTLNVAMLGALAGLAILPLDDGVLWAAIEKVSSPRYLEPNRRAFQLGQQAVRG